MFGTSRSSLLVCFAAGFVGAAEAQMDEDGGEEPSVRCPARSITTGVMTDLPAGWSAPGATGVSGTRWCATAAARWCLFVATAKRGH
jgi:hypothetical protein